MARGGSMNIAIVTACLLVNACVYRIDRTVVPTVDQVRRDAKYLKVHMRDGDVYVLDTWSLDPSGAELVGTGEHRGSDRFRAPRSHARGCFAIPPTASMGGAC